MRSLPLLFTLLAGLAPTARARVALQDDSSPRDAAELCADCHPGIVASYERTGMARALGPIRSGELDDLHAVEDLAVGLTYRLEQDLSGPRIVEGWRVGADGPRRERALPLGFAVGAGLLDRSYVAMTGRLAWFAPLEVLSADGDEPRRAALAPGHMIRPGSRFDIAITEECLACHTDALPPRDYPLNVIPKSWEPRGIGCDACHGDGAGHVEWRERELSGERPAGPDPILELGALSLEERLSVCARCHLQGDARLALTAGERGVPPPGGDFLQRWAVYVPERADDEVAFVSHVERLVASPCYTGSLERGLELSCELCHDPHVSVFEERERARARAGCAKCHPARHGDPTASPAAACALPAAEHGGEDCAACHMRETYVFDVADVRIHDHRIVRRPARSRPAEDLRVKHTRDGRLRAFRWPGQPEPAYAGDPGLSMMAALAAQFPDVAAGYVDREPGELARLLPSYHHLRGTLLERAARYDEARHAYLRALVLDPESVESEVNLALVLMRLSRFDEALARCDAVLKRHPRAEGALRNRAIIRLSMGDPEGFARDLAAANAILPRALNARALATHYQRMGDAELAEFWAAEADALGPRPE